MPNVPWYFEYLEIEATDTDALAACFAQALADSSVDAIVFDVDSPGGAVSGIADLSDRIFGARGKKPLSAHIHDVCLSAALWLAASTDRITASTGTLIGSIGTFIALDDLTAAFKSAGVARTLVSSGGIKGQGIEGTPVSEELVAATQKIVDGFTGLFLGGLARGRGLTPAQCKALATGHDWIAAEAAELGLIDQVTTPERAHALAAEQSLERGFRAFLPVLLKGVR